MAKKTIKTGREEERKSRKRAASATQKTSETTSQGASEGQNALGQYPLKKENFAVIGGGFLVVIIGYVLMYGTENIFSFRQMHLPTIVILLGFAIQLYGIMSKPTFLGSEHETKAEENQK